MNLEVILSMAGTIFGLTVSTLTFLVKFIKNAKAKKTAEQICKIGNAVIPYIEKAETFAGYSGAEKKEFVLTKANQFAIANDIAFDARAVSDKIEELVKMTKLVNAKASEQTAPALSPVITPR
jgi:hypothetical protein